LADGAKGIETAVQWDSSGPVFGGKHWRKEVLRRPSYRWENNNKMYLKEIYWDVVNWADLAQDKDNWWTVVNTVMNLLVQ
jgi:hypothetical protein